MYVKQSLLPGQIGFTKLIRNSTTDIGSKRIDLPDTLKISNDVIELEYLGSIGSPYITFI